MMENRTCPNLLLTKRAGIIGRSGIAEHAFPLPCSLVSLCQAEILSFLETNNYNSRIVKDLCKYVPEELLEPIFEKLIDTKKINDIVLMIYLSPSRHKLLINKVTNIRNSIFKLIGYNCPNLTDLNLSDCFQISNSVIRTILIGCPLLQSITLDRCQRITDSAFDITSTPFVTFHGILSLKMISLQGNPQITGEIIIILKKNCRQLQYLNLSQCKHIKNNELINLFHLTDLKSLNLSFIDNVDDETFYSLSQTTLSSNDSSSSLTSALKNDLTLPVVSLRSASSSSLFSLSSLALQSLNLCKCSITDEAIKHFATLSNLLELRLTWCTGITDKGVILLTKYCESLQILDLTSCTITDLVFPFLGRLCRKSLKELDLSWCMEVSNKGLRYLLPSYVTDYEDEETENCVMEEVYGTLSSHLEKLTLVWCSQINDESIEILANLPSLRFLALNGCTDVSSDAVDVFRQTGVEVVL
jgi:F-box/leucine-rich repeat protein 2/20